MFDADKVSTITFDSYSTVVDVNSAIEALEPYVDEPKYVASVWRTHSLMFTMAANDIDAYEPFYELNRHALTYALEGAGATFTEAERDEILSVYMDLYVFDDVREGMERLGSEYDLYIVSNGNPEMLDAMVDIADIGDLLTGVVSAQEVETFKPDAEIYRHAAARTGTPIQEIAHVSAGWFDVQGAEAAGMQGIWVNRDDGPWVNFDGEPALEVESFLEFADHLGL
ncbi:haloacid dehalogenase type II [Natronomonas sp. EA1]|uniref:haloacid dehalogenase type II n=1 Tax=Natronomonas sp. EA1 TaxID=3421655 RepID=UPI003EB77931